MSDLGVASRNGRVLERNAVRTWLLIAAVLYVPGAACAGAALLRVDGSAAGMQGLPMSLDGEFVGEVGDTIAIPPANHDLVIELPSGLKVGYQISRTNGRFEATALTESSCVGSTSWLTRGTPSHVLGPDSREPSLRLTPAQVSLEGMCPGELTNIGCFWRQASLEVRGAPGAEVWIDGIQVPGAGAASKPMSIGYCGGTLPRVVLVLRKAGYTTCRAAVQLQDEHGPYTLGCEMHKL
jgi:hypothetical protein